MRIRPSIAAAVALASLLGLWAWMRLREAERGPVVNAATPPATEPAALASPSPAGPAVIPLTLPSGKVLQTEVMVSDHDRQMGLMFRPSLPADRGMLFIFEEPGFPGIWMKNCRFPIDILWLDEEHRVVHLEESVPPCTADPCPAYSTLRRAAFVVEINAGQARREKATVGSRLQFTLLPGPSLP